MNVLYTLLTGVIIHVNIAHQYVQIVVLERLINLLNLDLEILNNNHYFFY